MMTGKIWQAEDIKNHLAAVRAWLQDSALSGLIPDQRGELAAHCQGGEAVLRYLAERFGVSLNGAHVNKTHELSLKTWAREDIEAILGEAWEIMHADDLLCPEQGPRVVVFYGGIERAISAVALTFGIKDFRRAKTKGVM